MYDWSWHRVVSGSSPRVTTKDAFDAEPSAFEDYVFEHRLHHVLATGRRIAA